MQTLKMKKVRENAIIPKRATAGSAGLDLCACIDEPLTVKAGERAVIPSGIAIALENSEVVALVFARSGLAIKHGISLSNSVGVIDSDYRGEICVGIINTSREDYTVNPGERIAQLVLTPVIPAEPVEVESLDETERGAGGFGSTGTTDNISDFCADECCALSGLNMLEFNYLINISVHFKSHTVTKIAGCYHKYYLQKFLSY